MKNEKGFTLIELLVTIALMLSILGIAIVSFINVSNRKKEEAYKLVKEQIITAAEQYFDSNEYLFEGLSEDAYGIITVGMLVENDFLNKVTDPRNGESINNCTQVKVTKKNGKYTSEFIEFDNVKKDNKGKAICKSNYSITVSEPGAPGISYNFYRQSDGGEINVANEDKWFNISKLGENGKLGVKVTGTKNGNGNIVGISNCTNNGKGECTNFSDYLTKDSLYMDNTSFSENTNGKVVCYKVTNISGKSAYTCAYAKVDTEKPTCNLNVSGSSKKENNAIKINYTGWYTDKVDVLIDDMSNDVKTWSWKSELWNSAEYNYKITKPSDKKEELYIITDGKNRSVSVLMEDEAGNENTISLGNINIDKTAPTITTYIENENQWVKENPKYGYDVIDNHSGIDEITNYWNIAGLSETEANSDKYKWNSTDNNGYNGYPKGKGVIEGNGNNHIKKQDYTFSGEGVRKYKATACDKAGNCANGTERIVKIDKTAPNCSVSFSGTRKNTNQSYWYTSNITLKGKCSDDLSGCKQNISTTISEEGKYDTDTKRTIGKVYDKAGNAKNCIYGTNFGIDKTAPVFDAWQGGRVYCMNSEKTYYNAWGYSIKYHDNLSGATAYLTEYYSSSDCGIEDAYHWADSKAKDSIGDNKSKIFTAFAGCDGNTSPGAKFKLVDGAGNESEIKEISASKEKINSSYSDVCNKNIWFTKNR